LFRQFLELPHGSPSHDTFRRVLQAVCGRGASASGRGRGVDEG
jgi:hypothetical protein